MELQSRCPEGGPEQCWGLGIALPVFGGTPDEESHARWLQRLGVEVSHVRSVVGCGAVESGFCSRNEQADDRLALL